MNSKTKKCNDCNYELERYLSISYDQFVKDFEIKSVSGDALTCNGIANCKTCDFPVSFMQECLIYEKLYLSENEI